MIDGRISLDLAMFSGASGTLLAAHESGLIVALMDDPATPKALAARLGTDPEATEIVLDVLAALGIADQDEGRYGASTALRDWDQSVPGGAVGWLSLWAHAPDYLRSGEPGIDVGVAPAEREPHYRRMASGSGAMYAAAAAELAERLPGSPERILDVGAGSGVWSLAMAERHRNARVVALDLSDEVLEEFCSRAAELGITDRAATLTGDFHELEVDQHGYDRVVIANVLRLETPERAAALLARVSAAVQPGGELVVIDALAGGTPERRAARALYRLNLAMRSRGGSVHDRETIESWIRAAGLTPTGFVEIAAWPAVSSAIVAVAPERPRPQAAAAADVTST